MIDSYRTALEALEGERAKIDTAIAAIRAVMRYPSPEVESAPRPPRPKSQPSSNDRGQRIVAHLTAHGPTRTLDLAETIKVSRYQVLYVLKDLEARRLVHLAGATSQARWHLGAAPRQSARPAKEEP